MKAKRSQTNQIHSISAIILSLKKSEDSNNGASDQHWMYAHDLHHKPYELTFNIFDKTPHFSRS